MRVAWYLICVVQLCLSISAIYAASLDNSGMKDVSVAAIWSTVLLLVNSILGYRYFLNPSSSSESSIMFGFWLGWQAMLAPTFLILSVFFLSFSELFEEDDDVHSAGGALGAFFLILAVFLSGFWVLVYFVKSDPAPSALEGRRHRRHGSKQAVSPISAVRSAHAATGTSGSTSPDGTPGGVAPAPSAVAVSARVSTGAAWWR